jgi:hypothetical protein
MSDLDLTETAEALFRWNTPTEPYFVIQGRRADLCDADDPYVPIVAAIATAIEQQVRERIAGEIEAKAIDLGIATYTVGVLRYAARIARGEAS